MRTLTFCRAMVRVMALMTILSGVISSGRSESTLLAEYTLSKTDALLQKLTTLQQKMAADSISPDESKSSAAGEDAAAISPQGFVRIIPGQQELQTPKTPVRAMDPKLLIARAHTATAVTVIIWVIIMGFVFLLPVMGTGMLMRNLPESLDCFAAVRVIFRLIGGYLILMTLVAASSFAIAALFIPSAKFNWSHSRPLVIPSIVGLLVIVLNRPFGRLVLWKANEP